LVRFLYLAKEVGNEKCDVSVNDAKTRICEAMSSFPYWPSKDISNQISKEKTSEDTNNNKGSMDKIVFWSENHILMTLSSFYLFRQWQRQNRIDGSSDAYLEGSIEVSLLVRYLRAHGSDSFGAGVYEANSVVYLPYSLSALLNLLDFSEQEEVRALAGAVIEKALRPLLLCTPSSSGVANLAASARSFPRCRLRNRGHNINQLLDLLNLHRSPDRADDGPRQLTDFLLTSTWTPSPSLSDALYSDQSIHALPLTHKASSIVDLYKSLPLPECVDGGELVPLYWSAGLILHPSFAKETRRYQKRKKMGNNTHLWPLSFVSSSYLSRLCSSYPLFSKGQQYTGIRLNVFKRNGEGLCLSSFERFNTQGCSFQQISWMANVSGVGVWSQSGQGLEGIGGFGMSSTFNPSVTQRGSLLIASYCAPHLLTSTLFVKALFSYEVRLFWPEALFDEVLYFQSQVIKYFSEEDVAEKKFVDHKTTTSKSWYSSAFGEKNKTMSSNRDVEGGRGESSGEWMAASKGDSFIGVLCTTQTRFDRSSPGKDCEMNLPIDSDSSTPGIYLVPRRKCSFPRHSWVVAVGTRNERVPNLQQFIEQRLIHIRVGESITKSNSSSEVNETYRVSVLDQVEGFVSNEVIPN
jgi:hypothetical protein